MSELRFEFLSEDDPKATDILLLKIKGDRLVGVAHDFELAANAVKKVSDITKEDPSQQEKIIKIWGINHSLLTPNAVISRRATNQRQKMKKRYSRSAG